MFNLYDHSALLRQQGASIFPDWVLSEGPPEFSRLLQQANGITMDLLYHYFCLYMYVSSIHSVYRVFTCSIETSSLYLYRTHQQRGCPLNLHINPMEGVNHSFWCSAKIDPLGPQCGYSSRNDLLSEFYHGCLWWCGVDRTW